jgi:predicted amidohydrolase YtcJ
MPPGQWIRTTNAWNDADLAERRLPTAAELDAATTQHLVLVRRGGYHGVANSLALQRAGISRDTPDPAGGSFGRLADGSPHGILEGGAVYVIAGFISPTSFDEQVAALTHACTLFNGLGLGAVRDPLIQRDELLIYQAAWERKALSLRCRPMVVVQPPSAAPGSGAGVDGTVADRIALVEGLGVRSGFGDDWLRLWVLKFVLDGGVEGATHYRLQLRGS